ncbi:c-type cytochrome domain-containing protein [Cytophagaceae bacterium DM2B3-1]|uniref:C-type cytochrome domain-containing protein n=1 Tax=Xanthocytophaga flava TaxID=3048013 RepID=A0ABT7CD75_9BACT|nr:c-type cytochrome domain-containing protein [Xanthocytophaga flavus]MDJ1491653.1 c-type cytochrome domain-containing protein [Xanthocytophaga flavus]
MFTITPILGQIENTPEWVLFLGRFHPLIVHFPIGMVIMAAIIEVFARSPKLQSLREANSFILLWGALGATVACIAGFMLSKSGGYDKESLKVHEWLGYGVAVSSWIAYFLKRSQTTILHKIYTPIFTGCVFLIFAAGHYGGNLTHGSDYLTQYMPQPIRSLAGLPVQKKEKQTIRKITDINQALVFEDLVQPALEQTCISCHNAEKQKGDLRMDTPEMLLKGGKNGSILVTGKAEDSEMIKRIHLPLEDDDHMPPKGKTQLSDNQMAMLRWWINQGAPFNKKIADLTVSEDMKPVLASFISGANTENKEDKPAIINVPKADAKAIDALRKINVFVMPIAQENNLLEISFINVKTFTDEQATLLTPVSQQTIWLKISHLAIGEKTITEIGKFNNLTRLHLEYTNTTDVDLKKIKGLKSLEYLNLIGTSVSDIGLKELASLKKLKKLYLWQTKVTPQGAAELQKALPETEINLGSDTMIGTTRLISEKK